MLTIWCYITGIFAKLAEKIQKNKKMFGSLEKNV